MTSSNLHKKSIYLKFSLNLIFFNIFKYLFAPFFTSDYFESKYDLFTNNLENLKLIE